MKRWILRWIFPIVIALSLIFWSLFFIAARALL